jgi:hypothetical protein
MKERCQYLFYLDSYESNISSNARVSIIVHSKEETFTFKEDLHPFSGFHKTATGEDLLMKTKGASVPCERNGVS